MRGLHKAQVSDMEKNNVLYLSCGASIYIKSIQIGQIQNGQKCIETNIFSLVNKTVHSFIPFYI